MDKTMIFWLPKGYRKPKMVGLATASGSALTLGDYAKMAGEGKGRMYVVDGANAAQGRRRIATFRGGPKAIVDGPVVALGANACLALRGTAVAIAAWDARIAHRGRVTLAESSALDPSNTGRRD